ncbi:hypothetical protein CAEBREN_24494 [Caenorhabditis brenneri]|uniref:TIL domain-containing protein n=1 Tax=Caenorhabditis brenneri TaxID=135651 RepID=G0MTA3_CAEBE|nr:hypothetical protein CAEBREN_24494 [Caenorhabditis brenneri]
MNFLKVFITISLIFLVALAAPNKKCGENEVFKKCGTACEANCAEGHVMFCTMQCIVNVCQCKEGFFRNKDKKCVPRNKC